MGKYEENLISNSIPLMEVDDEEFDFDSIEINADILDLVDCFGTDEFKGIYENLSNEIKSLDLEKKRILCNKLMNKIFELYEFEFIPELTFDNEANMDDFLNFCKFLDYNYIRELSLIVEDFDLFLFKKDLDLFLEKYSDEIISKIDFLIDNDKFSELISEFFRTNNKDNIIIFLKPRLQKDKMIIILKTMEGDVENG